MKILTTLLMTLLTIAGSAQAKEAISWAFDPWAPMHEKSDVNRAEGLLIELINAVLHEELGVPVEHHQLPWKRAQSLVKSGELDFMVTVPTAERKQYALISRKPVYSFSYKIFAAKNHPEIDDILKIETVEDIIKADYLAVSTLGTGWFEENVERPGARVFYAKTYTNVLEMLANGRGDLTIDVVVTTNATLKKMGLDDSIVNTGVEMGNSSSGAFYFVIGKKSKFAYILDQFDEAFARLEANGTLQRIIDKY